MCLCVYTTHRVAKEEKKRKQRFNISKEKFPFTFARNV